MKKLSDKNKWPKYIFEYLYEYNGLKTREIKIIDKKLNKNALKLFINMRYAVDPIRYDKMLRSQLLNELRYPRYD